MRGLYQPVAIPDDCLKALDALLVGRSFWTHVHRTKCFASERSLRLIALSHALFGEENIDLGLVVQGQGAIIAQSDANAEVVDRVRWCQPVDAFRVLLF